MSPLSVDPEFPSGTLTFLFTDVEGSTRMWEQHPAAMHVAMARHDGLIEECVARNSGTVVRPRGEGDSRFAVFVRAKGSTGSMTRSQQRTAR